MSLKNVVKANIYLSNLSRDFSAVNEVSDNPFGFRSILRLKPLSALPPVQCTYDPDSTLLLPSARQEPTFL